MKNRFLLKGVFAAMCLVLVGCAAGQSARLAAPESSVKVNVAAIKGPSSMGMVKMMDGDPDEFNFQIAASVDEITPLLVQGTVDISAVPPNIASILYHNTGGEIKVIAINTLGVLNIVENGDTVKTIEDLRGKTVYLSGKGGVPEYSLNYILIQNGIDPVKDVTLEFKSEHTECLTLLIQNENAVALLPQPFATTAIMKDDKIRICFDLNTEWEALQTGDNRSALITGAIIARKQFITEHPKAVDNFLLEFEKSVTWVNANIDDGAKLIEKFDIAPEQVAKLALPYCNLVCIKGNEMIEKFGGFLQVLFEQNPKSIGGALPDEAIYYIAGTLPGS